MLVKHFPEVIRWANPSESREHLHGNLLICTGAIREGQDFFYPALTHPSEIAQKGFKKKLGPVGVILIVESILIFYHRL